MRHIITYLLVRNLPKINMDFLFLKKPIIHITENKSVLDIKYHKHILYYS